MDAGEAPLPTPPPELTARLGGRHEDYDQIGSMHAGWIRARLPEEWDWQNRRVLDFGCGTGRSLVHFRDETSVGDFWGCDIDGPSIEWSQANLSPPFRFVKNGELPPIDLPDSSFDLVFGFSVFTHLAESWSAWLLEIHRLLDVGGYGIFSFLGKGMIEDVVGHEWDEDRIGMIGLDIGRPWAIGGPNVLHSEWWLRAHWGRAFDIVEVVPSVEVGDRRGHGIVVLRRNDGPAPTREQLEALEPDEPRELASFQYEVQLLAERMKKLWSVESGAMILENEHLRNELAALTVRSSVARRLASRLLGR